MAGRRRRDGPATGFAVDDAIGRPVSIVSGAVPDFLRFKPTVPVGQNYYDFALTRALTEADVGTYTVELTASDGTFSTTSNVEFELIVPEPTMILPAAAIACIRSRRRID